MRVAAAAVLALALLVPSAAPARSHTSLLPFVTPAPDQREAGSCLYMACTGALEMALRMRTPRTPWVPDGPLDLSERAFMALGRRDEACVGDWRTDTLLLPARAGGLPLNSSVRFTKGWYLPDDTDGSGPNGRPLPAVPGQDGARYGTYANWLPPAGSADPVPLPPVGRRVLFRPEDGSPHACGLLGPEASAGLKAALHRWNRPVLAIYDHFGIWHAVLVVGYDEDRPAPSPFADAFLAYAARWAPLLEASTDPARHARGRHLREGALAIRRNAALTGPAPRRGVFFVRDSIFASPDNAPYDYDPTTTGDESPYADTLVERDEGWLWHGVNHLTVVLF